MYFDKRTLKLPPLAFERKSLLVVRTSDKLLLETVVRNGKIVCDRPSLSDIRQNAALNFSKLSDIYKKLEGAPLYPVEYSKGLTELRAWLVEKIKREEISGNK